MPGEQKVYPGQYPAAVPGAVPERADDRDHRPVCAKAVRQHLDAAKPVPAPADHPVHSDPALLYHPVRGAYELSGLPHVSNLR